MALCCSNPAALSKAGRQYQSTSFRITVARGRERSTSTRQTRAVAFCSPLGGRARMSVCQRDGQKRSKECRRHRVNSGSCQLAVYDGAVRHNRLSN